MGGKSEKVNKDSIDAYSNRAQQAVGQAVTELRPLYTFGLNDAAAAVLIGGPDPSCVINVLKLLIAVILPGRKVPEIKAADSLGLYVERTLLHAWSELERELERALPFRWLGAAAPPNAAASDPKQLAVEVLEVFYSRLAVIRSLVVQDIQAAYDGDPAALSYAEVRLAYPGLLAVASHRIAHELYDLDVPIVPRIMSEWTHSETGVDIHPGAQIGPRFFVDHATGVVIGETAHIGANVKLYQGVTLGSRSFALDDQGNPVKRIQRHPTVEDNVVIYSNATILGGDTVIGAGSTIGGNVFLMDSVPPNSIVVQDGTAPKVIKKLR